MLSRHRRLSSAAMFFIYTSSACLFLRTVCHSFSKPTPSEELPYTTMLTEYLLIVLLCYDFLTQMFNLTALGRSLVWIFHLDNCMPMSFATHRSRSPEGENSRAKDEGASCTTSAVSHLPLPACFTPSPPVTSDTCIFCPGFGFFSQIWFTSYELNWPSLM